MLNLSVRDDLAPPREAPPLYVLSQAQADADATADATWRIVQTAVTRVFAVGDDDINGESRGVARAAHARQVAMYLAHVACHHTYTEVGRMANRDRTTVAYACAVIEDERDDPLFDAALTHLECSVILMANRQQFDCFNTPRGHP